MTVEVDVYKTSEQIQILAVCSILGGGVVTAKEQGNALSCGSGTAEKRISLCKEVVPLGICTVECSVFEYDEGICFFVGVFCGYRAVLCGNVIGNAADGKICRG